MGETATELATRLAGRWTKDCKEVTDVVHFIVKEQLLNSLSEYTHLFVREWKPKTSTKAGKLASDYQQPSKTTTGPAKPPKNTMRSPGDCLWCGDPNYWACNCLKARGVKTETWEPQAQQRRQDQEV